jgi:transcription elongation GreA/GreB family factor
LFSACGTALRRRQFSAGQEFAMSRAFVKETAEGAAPPERMVSSGPNLVTEEGLAKIAREVERLELALAAETNVLLRETLERDLRYWRQSLSTAVVVKANTLSCASQEPIVFGATVTFVVRTRSRALRFARNGAPQTIRIVGEDEADPKAGLVNFRSPLAQALMGAEVGDTVEMMSPRAELEILKVE